MSKIHKYQQSNGSQQRSSFPLRTLRAVVLATYFSAMFLFLLIAQQPCLAAPTTSAQAKQIVKAWLTSDASPLGASLGTSIKKITTYKTPSGQIRYFIAYLKPKGFVVVSGDDLVEPIIAFSTGTSFTSGSSNPLGALVSADLKARVAEASNPSTLRLSKSSARDTRFINAQRKWQSLADPAAPAYRLLSRTGSVSDPRVDPLIQSRWNQGKDSASRNYLYNYYTPNHYWSGCVATAMAQLMRYHQFPTGSVGTASHTIYVNSSPSIASIRGGNDAGGPYPWTLMPLIPNPNTLTLEQRTAIGRLLADAGTAVSMMYGPNGSGAYMDDAAYQFKATFGYSNSKWLYSSSSIPKASLDKAILPGLHAGYPVLLAIWGGGYGHAIACDGYGYNSATMYHHLNLGWGGADDAWYNLPNVDTSSITFNVVAEVIYNIYPTGTGEIIAGRVTDNSGSPLSGVLVSTGSASATSNARGLYSLAKLRSNSSFTLSAQKTGYSFASKVVTTGLSDDYSFSGTPGNVIVDLTGTPSSSGEPPAFTLQPISQTVNIGENATFSAAASGTAPLAYQWRKNGSNISGATSASYTITGAQAGDNGAVFSVFVSNSASTALSSNASLTVNMPPSIYTQPQSQTRPEGTQATFSVQAAGGAPLSYQWQKNGINIDGAVSSSYSLEAQALDNNATFQVIVSNSLGSVTSNAATLTVTARLYAISGRVLRGGSGLSAVMLDAGTFGQVLSDAQGAFTISSIPSGSAVEVIPSLTGYTFTPAVLSIEELTSNLTVNFAAQPRLFTISGQVVVDGNLMPGVTITGDGLGITTTDQTGYYSFLNVPYGTTYQLRPSLAGYQFTPGYASATVRGDTTVNFVAARFGYALRGVITYRGKPLSGVVVDAGVFGKAVTNASGIYTIIGITPRANYKARPKLAGYSFSPSYHKRKATSNKIGNFKAKKVALAKKKVKKASTRK